MARYLQNRTPAGIHTCFIIVSTINAVVSLKYCAIILLVSLKGIKISKMDLERMEEVYRKWESKANPASQTSQNSPTRTTMMPAVMPSGKKQWNDKIRDDKPERRRRRSGKSSQPPSLDLVPELARFKYTPPAFYETTGGQRPFMGKCCATCNGGSREMLFTSDIPSMGFRNVLKFNKPRRGLIARFFPHIYIAYSEGVNYAYPSAGKLAKEVLASRRVSAAIHKGAISDSEGRAKEEFEYKKALQRHAHRAGKALESMAASLSNVVLRLTGWVLLKVLGMILLCVNVHQGQMEMLKRAAKEGVPLVIMPTHRSHLDYVLMSFILYIYGIQVPFVAAGDNLNIPVFGWIMKKLGGFFIKRKLDKEVGKKDHVYRAVLHTYMEEALRCNQNIEFFIEGGRSRSGKALAPKGGLLSVIVDAYYDGVISDAFLVPASVGYDKILDGNFTNEQLGRPKRRETFVGALRGIWKVFSSKFGQVRVDFAEPFSLKEYLETAQMPSPYTSDLSAHSTNRPHPHPVLKKTVSDHSLYGTDVVVEDQRQLIRGLAEHIVYDAVRVNSIMSTNLVSFLLMTKHRQGVEFGKLVREAEWMKGEITGRGRDVGFSGEMQTVVRHALALLGPDLVTTQPRKLHPDVVSETESNQEGKRKATPSKAAEGGVEKGEAAAEKGEAAAARMVVPNMELPEVFVLSYYSNSVISVFLLESVIANAVIAVANQEMHTLSPGQRNKVTLSKEKVMSKALELCDLLQFEFIFVPPCGCLVTALSDALDKLIVSEIILSEQDVGKGSGSQDSRWARRVAASTAFSLDDDDEDDYGICTKEEQITVNVCPEQLQKLFFFQSVLGPLIEGYWLTACNLVRLLDRDLPEAEFSSIVSEYAQDRVSKGLAVYAESCAMDTLRNAWRLFQHWKVIDSYQDAEKVKLFHLKEPFRSEPKLDNFIDKIEAFRT
ncbi:glycerol-3-phosphate acyltransferase 1, mitochondrial-like isoform X2 [Acanthaster planci]|uniref:Glycerol-3-phosphate acyltransferase 1, mitochondrial-like isoform X2 n=1 Tax=Acanthaster planci TaxID=133434 RepID=A0A8B7Z0F9_ACAPL|nr:glycerol-3-phosphate acyltransferase 1, mitochondrial-like isoform X2 [Acanthaster planci]